MPTNLIYSDRKQISDCLKEALGQDRKEKIKGHREVLEGMDRFIILIMVLLIVPWVDEYIKSPQDTVYCLIIIPQQSCSKRFLKNQIQVKEGIMGY